MVSILDCRLRDRGSTPHWVENKIFLKTKLGLAILFFLRMRTILSTHAHSHRYIRYMAPPCCDVITPNDVTTIWSRDPNPVLWLVHSKNIALWLATAKSGSCYYSVTFTYREISKIQPTECSQFMFYCKRTRRKNRVKRARIQTIK